MLARHSGMTGAYEDPVIDLLTSDPGILLFTSVGIVATAVSILRDAREQKVRLVSQDASGDVVEVRAA
jgi:hypothetical protein